MGLEATLQYLGRFGKYQIVTYIMIAVCMNFPTAWQLYGITFEGPSFPMPYGCDVKEHVGLPNGDDPCSYHPFVMKGNQQHPDWEKYKNQTLNGVHHYYDGSKQIGCEKYKYFPKPIYKFPEVDGTIQQEFDIVCDKINWITWSQVIFTGGSLVGAALCPPFGDYLGRRSIFFICQLLMCIFGIGMAFSPNLASFCVFQFLTGAFAMGNDLCGFVIACELFPKDMRSFVSPLIYAFFAIGSALLPLWSIIFPKWNHLQLFISVISLITLAYWPFCPESWRWLLSKGRKKEAEDCLNLAAIYNGIDRIDPAILHDGADEEENVVVNENDNFFTYMSKPKLLMYALAMAFIMGSSNLVYFGLGLMVATLSGDFYVNFACLALVEIIGVILAVLIVSFAGRRYPISGFFLWAAVFLFLAVIFDRAPSIDEHVDKDLKGKLITSFVVISKIGVTAAYCVILVYIQEIYPTFMRASGIGFTAGLGNIGTVMAPIAILSSKLEFDKFYIPIIVFGCVSFMAALATLLLPETLGRVLPTTINEVLHMPHTLTAEEWTEARRQACNIFFFWQSNKFAQAEQNGESNQEGSSYSVNNTKQNDKPQEFADKNGNGRDNPAYTGDKGGVTNTVIRI
ncbi:DgyrCDS5811 [Dimorphilus gyrociliatus]|uniref:DgyrCDS5811 n=1 Tax=Dimorphilus gyrociliatus TaxID=2664684 RepID=A0A7I8VQV8_9ANNE|nr:DgyrCDS5811 [Dimorphilus gyrociliatus]